MVKASAALTMSLSIAALSSFIAIDAKAGCGADLLQKSAYGFASPQANGFSLVSASTPSIVGMWKVTFTSNGKLVDFGYSVWHSDGTEILNSGNRAPVTENFCLGV